MAGSFNLPVTSPLLPRRTNRTLCFAIDSRAKIPMPPINPRDPFLSRLASVADMLPEKLLDRTTNLDMPPYLDLYDSPTLVATPVQIHTVAVGAAIGQACLLLAAGSKGKRFMMPHSKAMIQQPRARHWDYYLPVMFLSMQRRVY